MKRFFHWSYPAWFFILGGFVFPLAASRIHVCRADGLGPVETGNVGWSARELPNYLKAAYRRKGLAEDLEGQCIAANRICQVVCLW